MANGLATAIDELLDTDPADLTDDQLHELVVSTQRQTHRLAAARAQLLAAWDTRRCWAGDGSRSPAHRLAREASMSVRAAKTEIRRATALGSMPHARGALSEGSLCAEHVDLLAAANSGTRRALFEPHEEMLVEQCKLLRFADAYRMIEYWKQRADATATEDDAERQHEGRGATAATTLDGMVDVRALLDPLGGAAYLNELVRLMELLRLDDERNGRVRTAPNAAPTPWSKWPPGPAPPEKVGSAPAR